LRFVIKHHFTLSTLIGSFGQAKIFESRGKIYRLPASFNRNNGELEEIFVENFNTYYISLT